MINYIQQQAFIPMPIIFPVQVPPCNNFECLQYLINKHPGVEFSDIFKSFMRLVYMSNEMVKDVLDKILNNARKTKPEASYYDSHYWFNLTETRCQPYFKKAWDTADNTFYGQGLGSLVKFIRGGSDIDAMEFVAEVGGINFTKTNVPQVEKWEGHSFIRQSHAYPSVYSSSIAFVFKLFGPPQKKYPFHNANGHPSFFLLEWEIRNKPLRLFVTLQQPDNHDRKNNWEFIDPLNNWEFIDPLNNWEFINPLNNWEFINPLNVWEFIAPPVEYRIFNKHLIDQYKDREIHIHDDIRNADYSNTSQAVGTWAGDQSFASDLDWSFLKDRKVNYLFNLKNPESCKIGSYLLQAFQGIGIKLHLYEYIK